MEGVKLTREAEHGGYKYMIGRFDGEEGQLLALKVVGLLAPAFIELTANVKPPETKEAEEISDTEEGSEAEENNKDALKKQAEEMVRKMDISAISRAFKALFSGMNYKETNRLIMELMEKVEVQVGQKYVPVKNIYGQHFAQRYGAVFYLVSQVIDHNGFLDLLGDII